MSRNERKRLAKAKHELLVAAVAEALDVAAKREADADARQARLDAAKEVVWAPGDVKNAQFRNGRVSGGKFFAAKPVIVKFKRPLVKNAQGVLIERRIRYVK